MILPRDHRTAGSVGHHHRISLIIDGIADDDPGGSPLHGSERIHAICADISLDIVRRVLVRDDRTARANRNDRRKALRSRTYRERNTVRGPQRASRSVDTANVHISRSVPRIFPCDDGSTGLGDGSRVAKDHERVEAFGTVDELNAQIGLLRAELGSEHAAQHLLGSEHAAQHLLGEIQHDLFDLGGELATPAEAFQDGMYRVGAEQVTRLEKWIDQCQLDLEPLKSFILPGGGRIGAYLHQCRTVCRRAEREILRLSRNEEINPHVLEYFNRLSDLFFVLSRWIAKQTGEQEYLWQRGLQQKPRKG